MDWQTLSASISNDRDYPDRANRIAALTAVVEGRQYDKIPFDFWDEEDGSGKYVKLEKRRPAVRTNLCKTTVDECGSLLFSQGRFPRVLVSGNPEESDRLQELVMAANLREVMQDAVNRGSVGSVALHVKFLGQRVFVDVLATTYLTPTFDPNEPDNLAEVVERYKIRGSELNALYGGKTYKDNATYWWMRRFGPQKETIYEPQPITDASKKEPPAVREEVNHGLGFVPVVWIKNLPGGDAVDGVCTFETAIDTVIELDYMESQANRAMRYMGDPKLFIRGKFNAESDVSGGAANALVVDDANGDAKLLELQGGSSEAFDKRVKALRRTAMESMHGNLSDPEKVSAATSGRAMELLHQPQIWQSDRLRVSYGNGLMKVLAMIGQGAAKYTVMVQETKLAPFGVKGVSLSWGAWFDPTYGDIVSFTSGLQNATMGGIISEETATNNAAVVFGIVDVAQERAKIETERAAADARLIKVKATATATLPEST